MPIICCNGPDIKISIYDKEIDDSDFQYESKFTFSIRDYYKK